MTATAGVRIAGRVQGVGFRYWTQQQARALGLSGWVRNEPDGSVRAVFHGADEAVRTMLAKCRSGPVPANVEKIDINCDGIDAPDPCKGFTILR